MHTRLCKQFKTNPSYYVEYFDSYFVLNGYQNKTSKSFLDWRETRRSSLKYEWDSVRVDQSKSVLKTVVVRGLFEPRLRPKGLCQKPK